MELGSRVNELLKRKKWGLWKSHGFMEALPVSAVHEVKGVGPAEVYRYDYCYPFFLGEKYHKIK